jgi:hypothetical protein
VIRNLTLSNRTGLCLQSGVHLNHFLPSALSQRYLSGVIQTSLQLTVTDICDPELDFIKQNWVMSAEWKHLTHFLPSSLAQRYVSGVITTSLQLTVTDIFDPEHEFIKQNCVISAEWSTLDSLPPFLSSSLPLLHRDMCPG